MIVVIAGMPRSGSTFSFNIVRELLQQKGPVYWEPTSDIEGALSRAPVGAHVIVKTHAQDAQLLQMIQRGTARAICTVRPVEDAAASMTETWTLSVDEAIGQLRDWFSMYRRIVPHCLTLDHQLIDSDPATAAQIIADYVSPGVDAEPIGRKFSKENAAKMVPSDKLGPGVRDVGFSYYDETTLLHRRHIASLTRRSAEERLSAADLQRVRSSLCAEIDFLTSLNLDAREGNRPAS